MSPNIRVLIVDDEPTMQEMLELAIEEKGWHVEAVESAEAALECLAHSRFDLLLVDKNLPGMTGVELIHRVRDGHRDIGVIMITGYASVESASETLHLGVDAYIEKPFDNVYDVVERIEATVASRESRRQSDELLSTFERFRRAAEALKGISSQARDHGDLCVLVVSPDSNDHAWFESRFHAGTNVIGVSGPDQAINEALREKPDVIVVDASIQDPGLIEFLCRIRQSTPDAVAIVVAEKHLTLGSLTQLIDLNVRVVMDKPLDAGVLQRKLSAATNQIQRALDFNHAEEITP